MDLRADIVIGRLKYVSSSTALINQQSLVRATKVVDVLVRLSPLKTTQCFVRASQNE